MGVFAGLLFPTLARFARPFLVPAILVPFIVALLRVDPGRARVLLRRPGDSLLMMAWLLAVSPLLVWLVTLSLELPPGLRSILITTAGCAPVMASGALAVLLELDVAVALLLTAAATLLVPLTLPPVAVGLARLALHVDSWRLALRLSLMIGGCVVLAGAIRRSVGELRLLHWGRAMDGAAVFGLLVFAVAVMDGVPDLLRLRPGYGLVMLSAVFLLNLSLQSVGAALFWGWGRRTALTIGLLSGNRNIGIVLAAVAAEAPVEFRLYVALAQFPIYLLPMLQKPVYERLLSREEDE